MGMPSMEILGYVVIAECGLMSVVGLILLVRQQWFYGIVDLGLGIGIPVAAFLLVRLS